MQPIACFVLVTVLLSASVGCGPQEDDSAAVSNELGSRISPPVIAVSQSGALSWAAVPRATGYNLYKDNSYLTTLIGATGYTTSAAGTYTATSFDKSVTPTQFSVTSNAVTWNPTQVGGRIAPPVLSATASGGLSWAAVPRAKGYNIYKDGSYLTTVTGATTYSPSAAASYSATSFDNSVNPTEFSVHSNAVNTRPGTISTPPAPPTGGQGCLAAGASRSFPPMEGFSCSPNGVIDANAHGWFSSGWLGSGTATRSADGRMFGIAWKNTNPLDANNHKEFDISVARSGWVARDLGYGNATVNSTPLSVNMQLTSRGRFVAPLTAGKFHTQAIIWLVQGQDTPYNRKNPNDSNACLLSLNARDSVDITVANWVDATVRGAYKKTHDTGSPSGTVLNQNTRYLGDITLSGSTYWAFKRPIGDVCEKESFYLLRATDLDYATGARLSTIDIRETITKLPGAAYLKDWNIFMAGWELAGGNQSQGANGSQVEFRYDCISLPAFKSANRTPTISTACN